MAWHFHLWRNPDRWCFCDHFLLLQQVSRLNMLDTVLPKLTREQLEICVKCTAQRPDYSL